MDRHEIRQARTTLIRKAVRHLELATRAEVAAVNTRYRKAFKALHLGCASRCINDARALTRKLHPQREPYPAWADRLAREFFPI